MRSQVSQRESADEGVDMWVNCKLITASHQNSEAHIVQCEYHTGK